MSLQPEKFDESMVRVSQMGYFDRKYAEGVTRELRRRELYSLNVPGKRVIYDGDTVRVSKANVLRGNAFSKLLELADKKGLLVESLELTDGKGLFVGSQFTDKTFVLWRAYHSATLFSVDKLNDTVSMTDYNWFGDGGITSITWRNEDPHGNFLSRASKIAILTLSLASHSLWKEIAKKGLVAGRLTGDIYSDPWWVDGSVVLYPVKENILGYEGKPGTFVAEEADQYKARLHNGIDETVRNKRQAFVASHDVVGIFADMRSMK